MNNLSRYMLDTNICIYVIKKKPFNVIKHFLSHDIREVCISAVTLAEMEYGVQKSSNPIRNKLAIVSFLSGMGILPFDHNAAEEYGYIRSSLEKRGTPIGANDLLIAAHARANGCILVTNNTKEFCRVEGLQLENWTLNDKNL